MTDRYGDNLHDDDRESDAFDLAALLRSVAAPEWVSVEERLPEPGVPVLGLISTGAMWVCTNEREGGEWWERYRSLQVSRGITHWQPLPAPPLSVSIVEE